ncbi:hypothetical protein XI06_22885 [Bradyrhizobium sp. CCBAU 11434]|nr:hypothetical protein [Bradyrhizobium sp. CCBAU 11434]
MMSRTLSRTCLASRSHPAASAIRRPIQLACRVSEPTGSLPSSAARTLSVASSPIPPLPPPRRGGV